MNAFIGFTFKYLESLNFIVVTAMSSAKDLQFRWSLFPIYYNNKRRTLLKYIFRLILQCLSKGQQSFQTVYVCVNRQLYMRMDIAVTHGLEKVGKWRHWSIYLLD